MSNTNCFATLNRNFQLVAYCREHFCTFTYYRQSLRDLYRYQHDRYEPSPSKFCCFISRTSSCFSATLAVSTISYLTKPSEIRVWSCNFRSVWVAFRLFSRYRASADTWKRAKLSQCWVQLSLSRRDHISGIFLLMVRRVTAKVPLCFHSYLTEELLLTKTQ